ncbi:MAG: DUF11 domain-containing protein [Anaerolineales bacterium]|nr:DUF11 domain-containing protein [Anaerolineales bacterium]
MIAKDSQGGTWTDQDSVAVDLIRPQIGVTETADKPQFEPGETVTFFAEVTNTGDTPLWDVTLTPDLAGCQMVLEETLEPGQALQPGEAWHYSCAVPLTEDATNTVLAQGQDIRDRTVQATASTTVVKVARPNIELRKTVDKPIVYPGETANFKVVVKNTGTVVLRHVRVWDSLEQCKLSGPKGDNGDGKLSPNEEWTYTCAVVFCKKDAPPEVAAQCTSPDLCKDVVNTATVVARTPDGRTVSDQDSVAVDLIRPKLGVTETVDKPRFEAGETVTFKADVKNTGDTALWDVTLTPDLAGCTMIPEQAIQPGQALQPGDTWRYTCGVVLTESATNNVVARGHDERGRWVSATASASAVKIERPAIDLTKTVDKPVIYPGETANFKIVVKNTGTVVLRQVQVWDSLEQCKLSAPKGDNGDGKLSPNEEWTYTCAVVFCKNEAPPEVAAQCTAPDLCRDVVNTAKVTAKDSQGQVVSDQDRVAVDLVRLKIGVTETVDKPQFTPGEMVTFKADVKNTGELPLWDVTLTPDLAGCTMMLQNAITPGQALQPGETWSYTCGVVLNESATNNVVARGHDERGRWVSATASASAVKIVRPAIDLTKTVDKPVIYPGETANFKIVVKNTGGVTLRYVTVTDSLPQCKLSAPKGDNGDGKLSPNEEWTYTCAVVFCKDEAPPEVAAQCTEPDLCADVVNTARVTAKDWQGQTVSDQDSVAVDLVRLKIGVTETVDKPQFTPGETVTFKADVKNTGELPLWDVTLTPDLAGCTMLLQNAITPGQALQPGETWSYTCGVVLSESATNNVVARGHDERGRWVSATASASAVKIVRPAIDLTKTVDKPVIYPGETANFKIVVKNTGGVTLRYVTVTDSLPQCKLSAPTGDNGDGKLSPNEEWTYTCAVVFCKNEAPPEVAAQCTEPDLCADVVNTARVTAKDSQGQIVSDQDSVAVDLVRPKIGVTETVDKAQFTPGETVTFKADVKNTGDTALWDVSLTPDLAGCTMMLQNAITPGQALDPGETWSYTCGVVLTENATNNVVAKGRDARNREVSATASASSTKIVTSKILIDKSVDKPIIYPGESVKFTILVKNTGTDVLSYVNVTDSMPQCTLSARVGDNGDGKLSPNEQWTYTCSVVFCKWEAPPALGVLCTAPDVCADTVNSATVTAKDSQGKVWSATDSVAVDLIRPKIGVAGSVDKPHFAPGDTLTFSAVVTNTGDAPLWNVVALSDLAGCTMALQEAELADQALQPGGVLHFDCEVSLTQSVTNKVVAKGFDARNRAWSKVVDIAVVADGVAGQVATDLLSFANHVFMPVTQR